MLKGIDVSDNNGEIKIWNEIKQAGINFVIARSSFGIASHDYQFSNNIAAAKNQGLLCGAYHYGYALTPDKAIIEAQNCIAYIAKSGFLLELPIFYDMEDADNYKKMHNFDFSQENVQAICRNFCYELGKSGLKTGIYASYDWITKYNLIDLGFPIWSAQWNNTDDLNQYAWQYTDSLNISGQLFDGDIIYSV